MHLTLALLLVLIPVSVDAKVIISEFMYDAPDTDTDKEYIELYNDGSAPVDLTKWKIHDGSNHTLNVPPKNGGTGSITIPSNGYVVLVNDATVFAAANSVSISIIDTVLSLGNTNGTIQLLNESGAVEDSVTYAKANGAAGTGDTLHWNGSGYVSGASTIGSAFAGGSVAKVETETQTQTSEAGQTNVQTPPVSSYVVPPQPQIHAYAGKSRDVIAGADTEFIGSAYDRNGDEIDNVDKVRFLWTFGDGASAEGARVSHRFAQPGKYAVVLDIAQVLSAASAQITVTAHPVSIEVSVADGAIVLSNKAHRDIDISGWRLRSGGTFFTLPQRSILLSGASVPFPSEVTKLLGNNDAQLEYPNGTIAAHAGETVAPPIQETKPEIAQSAQVTEKKVSISEEKNTPELEPAREQDIPEQEAIVSTTTALTASAIAGISEETSPWWTGAGVVTLLGAVGAAFARRMKQESWDIEEITE